MLVNLFMVEKAKVEELRQEQMGNGKMREEEVVDVVCSFSLRIERIGRGKSGRVRMEDGGERVKERGEDERRRERDRGK